MPLIFVANHRGNPTEPVEEWKAFQERCINRLEDAKVPPIKEWDRNAFLPEECAHCGEMELTMFQLLKFSADGFDVAH